MKTIVLGIGNPILKDDSVGIKVVEEVKKRAEVDVDFMMSTDLDVVYKLMGYEKAIVVDGIKTGNEPGTIYVLSLDDLFVSYKFSSSHSLDLATAIKIGYEVFKDEMPKDLKIIAIEVDDANSFGYNCSESVRRAIPEAVKIILRELEG